MPTTALHNSKVSFSIIEKYDNEFLVCTSITGSLRVRYVENLKTGKRAFPTQEETNSVINQSEFLAKPNLDNLVEILIDKVK